MEDYEKKYKEALENMRRFRDALNNHEETDLWVLKKEIVTDIEYYFPELKNKDEKIRNRILLSLEKDLMATKNSGCNTQDLEQCIAWLKKQGTQVKLSEEEQNSFAKGVLSRCALSFIDYLDAHSYEGKMCVSNGECEDIDYAFHNAMWDRLHRYYCKYIEKQGEQKPAVVDFNAKDWYVSKVDGKIHDMTYNPADKVEPKFKIGDVLCDKSCTTLNKNSQPNIKILDIRNDMYICNNCIFPISQQNEYELVTKKIEQKSAWSDEDERMYRMCVDAVEYYHTPEDESTIRDWLKSLKERNAWKPSKEQMDALLGVMVESGFNYIDYNTLESLYNDLKKL